MTKVSKKDFQKLAEKVRKLEEQKEEIQKQNKKLVKEINEIKQDRNKRNINSKKVREQDISRRTFLKKLGLGAAGLGALTMSPTSALNIKDDDLDIYTGTSKNDLTKYLSITQNGEVKIQNTDLMIKGETAATQNWASGHGLENSENSLRINAEDIGTGINGGSGTNLSLDKSVIESGGAKEINLTNLKGDLADPQNAKNHASSHHNGAGDEIEASNLSGSNGTSGQVLATDGASTYWNDIPNSISASDFVSESGSVYIDSDEMDSGPGRGNGSTTVSLSTNFDAICAATVHVSNPDIQDGYQQDSNYDAGVISVNKDEISIQLTGNTRVYGATIDWIVFGINV